MARNDKDKAILLEQLKKTPIIQMVCQKVNIPRPTFYRWRRDDKVFAEKVDAALDEGKNLINDMAESQLLSFIQDKNLQAIIFWLKNHHQSYKTKVELTTKHLDRELTPEEKELIKQAILMAQVNERNQNDS